MALNTSVEPFISAMLRQPDAKSIAQGIPRAIQGFAGSYLARKEIEESENRKPEAERASGFERFVGGFVNGPGRIAEGQEPFSVQKRNLNDQVNQILKDPVGLANEIGNLSPDDIPNWVAKNAGFAAHPLGKAMLDTALKAYGETQEMKYKSLEAQRRVNESLLRIEMAKRPLSQFGREEFDAQRLEEAGDYEGAARVREGIALRKQKVENEITRLENEAIRLDQAGDRNAAANVRLRLQGLKEGYTVNIPEPDFGSSDRPRAVVNPTDTVPESGVGPDALSPSTVTQSAVPQPAPVAPKPLFEKIDRTLTAGQEGILKETAAFAVDTAKRIEDVKAAADTIFGPAAALGEIVVDKALSNIAPELLNKERVRGREAARYVKEGIYRSLNKGQGVLSDKDVQRMNELYPALKGLDQALESPARAKVVLSSLQQQIAQDAYAKTRLRGLRPDVENLSYLPPKFIREEFKAGRITEDEARAAINSSPYQDEITEEINRGRK